MKRKFTVSAASRGAGKGYVDSVEFAGIIANYLDDEFDKAGSDTEVVLSPQYNQIDLHYCHWGASAIMDMIAQALTNTRWLLYQNLEYMNPQDYVAIDGDRFVRIGIDSFGTDTYISIDYPNSSIEFEDWYDAYKSSVTGACGSKTGQKVEGAADPEYPYEMYVTEDDPYDAYTGVSTSPITWWRPMTLDDLREFHRQGLEYDECAQPGDIEMYEYETGEKYKPTPADFDEYIRQGLNDGWLRPAQ